MGWWETVWFTLAVALASSVIGWGINHFYYRKSIRSKACCYDVLHVPLVTPLIANNPNLKIQYAGEEGNLRQLGMTMVVLWNGGTETIRRGDLPTDAPLVITATGCTILEANIAQVANRINKFALKKNEEKTRVEIDFEYMDQNEGVILTLLHTGATGNELKLEGVIMGAGAPILKERLKTLPAARLQRPILQLLLMMALGMAAGIGIGISLMLNGLYSGALTLLWCVGGLWVGYVAAGIRIKMRAKEFPLHDKLK